MSICYQTIWKSSKKNNSKNIISKKIDNNELEILDAASINKSILFFVFYFLERTYEFFFISLKHIISFKAKNKK